MWGAVLGALGRSAAFAGAAEGATAAGARAGAAGAASEGSVLTGRVIPKGAMGGGPTPPTPPSATGAQAVTGRFKEFAASAANQAVAQHAVNAWQTRYDADPFNDGRNRR